MGSERVMDIQSFQVHVIRCSVCGKFDRICTDDMPKVPGKLFRSRGWRGTETGGNICPKCRAALKEVEEQNVDPLPAVR